MTLKKEDFTDEQWAEIQAEADRRVTDATKTARKNAEKDAEDAQKAAVAAAVAEAVEAERVRAALGESEQLEVERKALDARAAEIAAERKSLAATKKLVGVVPDDALDTILPLFVNLPDDQFETAIDAFIKVNHSIVETKVDEVKQGLLHGATPPAGGTGAPVDQATKVAELLKSGNDAAAIDALMPEPTQ